jgi:DNA-binding MarR family transcriptional regulator
LLAGDLAGAQAAAVSQPPHPVNGLNELVHQRVRLGILAIAAEAEQVDFGYLRGALGLTDGNLSRHLQVLEQAKLIAVRKGYTGRRPRTWVRITAKGRKALDTELAALRTLIAQLDRSQAVRPDHGDNHA